jgi:hypothetical protein
MCTSLRNCSRTPMIRCTFDHISGGGQGLALVAPLARSFCGPSDKVCDVSRGLEGRRGALTFTLSPESLVLSSDEHGFTHADLVAISSFGESTKTGGRQTGQKGTGASVFLNG